MNAALIRRDNPPWSGWPEGIQLNPAVLTYVIQELPVGQQPDVASPADAAECEPGSACDGQPCHPAGQESGRRDDPAAANGEAAKGYPAVGECRLSLIEGIPSATSGDTGDSVAATSDLRCESAESVEGRGAAASDDAVRGHRWLDQPGGDPGS
jgi:hypothetical protein